MKSELSAFREAVLSELSIAATTLALTWVSRSETDWPAVDATSEIEVARLRLMVTASRAPMSARCPCAMAQTDALSLALLTAKPVLIRFWVVLSVASVALRFCSAISAAALVLTLSTMVVLSGPPQRGR